MKNLYCGEAPQWLIDAFYSNDINLVTIGREEALPSATSHHIDLTRVKVLNKWFTKDNISTKLGKEYPLDVPLNVAQVGDYLFCNPLTCAKEILELASENLEIIPVKQGYTKCSTLVLNGNAIITEDEGIAKACPGNLEVLLIDKGFVRLPGYDYGFIGGASTVVNNIVYFFGYIQNHPSYDKINSFINAQNMSIVSLSKTEQLLDIGGVVDEI